MKPGDSGTLPLRQKRVGGGGPFGPSPRGAKLLLSKLCPSIWGGTFPAEKEEFWVLKTTSWGVTARSIFSRASRAPGRVEPVVFELELDIILMK